VNFKTTPTFSICFSATTVDKVLIVPEPAVADVAFTVSLATIHPELAAVAGDAVVVDCAASSFLQVETIGKLVKRHSNH